MIDISDFVPQGPVDPETVESYRGRVPDEVIGLWQRYGYGTFGKGFFRLIDPGVYERGIGDVLGKVTGEATSVPIIVTGLADVITWEAPDGVTAIRYRLGDTRGVGYTFETMIKLVEMDGEEELSETYDWDLFPQAVQAHGAPAFDESFVFVPLLSLGGERRVENMRARRSIEAVRTMVEFGGVIEH